MANYKQSFKERSIFDPAEKFFEFYCAKNEILCTRYGLDQRKSGIPGGKFITMNKMIRCSPDYIIIKKDAYFVEVKGCNDELKMKLSDVRCYEKWNKIMPLVYFFYSKSNNNYKKIKHEDFLNIAGGCKTDRYPDNNEEHYCVPWRLIP